MQKNKTIPKAQLQEYVNWIQSKEVDLLQLAHYLAVQSNGLFEVNEIKKQKNWF